MNRPRDLKPSLDQIAVAIAKTEAELGRPLTARDRDNFRLGFLAGFIAALDRSYITHPIKVRVAPYRKPER